MILQCLGGAFISANSGAIIADTFQPADRGRACGRSGADSSAGAVLGISVGGRIHTGIHVAPLASASTIGVAIALAILRGGEARAHIPRPTPAPALSLRGGTAARRNGAVLWTIPAIILPTRVGGSYR